MTRTYCDCCGKEVKGSYVVDLGFPDAINHQGETIIRGRWELCGDCHRKVRLFLLRMEWNFKRKSAKRLAQLRKSAKRLAQLLYVPRKYRKGGAE